jgi:hypothetical protein
MLGLGFQDLLWLVAVLALFAVWIARLCRKRLAWPLLAALTTGVALLAGFNWHYFYGDGTIIYSPTTAQVTGTWAGNYDDAHALAQRHVHRQGGRDRRKLHRHLGPAAEGPGHRERNLED